MPPIDKVKTLRRRVNCTLQQAIHLLNQTYRNSGEYNIEQAITLFHQKNIELIYQATEDKNLARLYYERYYDIEKAIDKIKEIQANTVDILMIRPSGYVDKIRFHLYKENNNSGKEDKGVRRLYIPQSDFRYVKPAFEDVYPTYNYRSRKLEDTFNHCFDNHFNVKNCQAIVDNLYALNTALYRPDYSEIYNRVDEGYTDEELNAFRLKIIDWITQRFLTDDSTEDYHLVVEGNL